MGNIFGFKGDYTGLEDNEAWTRIYDVGKNLMPIRNSEIQKKYNSMFKKKTRVVRNGKVKVVKTDSIVPDDIVILEKGCFVPVDGIILEEHGLDIENDILFEAKYKEIDEKYYVEGKPIYQGMKVKSGRALVETKKTGDSTFLGERIKQIDVPREIKHNNVNNYFLIMLVFSIVVFILGFLFSFLSTGDFILAFISSLVIFISALPIGFCIVIMIKMLMAKNLLKKSRIILKNEMSLLEFKNLDVACVDDKFLTRDYNTYIQNLYKSGIGIVVISKENLEDTITISKDSGIIEKDFDINLQSQHGIYSGEEISKMTEDEVSKAVGNGLIFYNMNHNQKEKIIKGFKSANISILCLGDGIEDIVSLSRSDFSISSNNVKGSIDREISDALIWGNDFSSIYEFIKQGKVFKNDVLNCFNFNIAFQLPVIILLLLAIAKNMVIGEFYVQAILISLGVIPALLALTFKNVSDDKVFEPNINHVSVKNYIKMILIGCFISIILAIEYLGLGVLIKNDFLNISIVTVSLALIYFVVIKLINK